ncbi:MAG: leucine--tRNA ligase [Patescibacteria group bacterium]
MDKNYDHKEIEKKWQKIWSETEIYKTSEKLGGPKSYVLDMFPYPSGDGLHVGHPKGYIATDIYSRTKKMQGHNVLHPMGWDAFGLPAENYAIKNKIHPKVAVEKNIQRFKEQLEKIGFNYDWKRETNTTDPEYYKWTQWIFLKLLEKGLAYESNEPINWCPSCQTGLANEDLEDGRCERCGSVVEKRPMRQWVLRITQYADRMLEDLEKLDWPESIKERQRNWIGRSEGMLFTAPVKDTDLTIQTYSAHFEAFAADTFVVIAPDHPFLPKLVAGTKSEKEVLEFAKKLIEKRNKEGYEGPKEPEGIFTGRYISDPVGNGDLPIWVANYALADYGTGIVKCSAHDERDFAFAKKYNIKLKPVSFPEDQELRKEVENLEICFTDMENSVLTEPEELKGKVAGESKQEIMDYLVKNKLAERKVVYRLKDWVFSRQRYWGEPIPVVHCENCGVVGVPEKDLPIKLPEIENYEPTGTGESPLANIESWVNTTCPKCGGPAKRETNTMPQWAGSSWYYLRFIDPHNDQNIVDLKKEKYWSPVDMYVGGAEHATRHLIYARFWHKFLFDIGLVNYQEPFKKLQNVGLILAEDGKKMSKRYGNVINPDDIVSTWGADSLRLYEMFMGPFNDAIAWNTDNMMGVRRFLEKVWRLSVNITPRPPLNLRGSAEQSEAEVIDPKLENLLHKTIKKVTEDIESFKFNTAISSMMIFLNELEKQDPKMPRTRLSSFFEVFLKLLAPFAPHITEEIWSHFAIASRDKSEKERYSESIHIQPWPEYDEAKILDEQVTIVVQINGKVRGQFEIEREIEEEKVKKEALALEEVQKWLGGKEIKKVIFVPEKLINFVV